MFTEKAKKTAEACRFCWMCRHLCPVGFVTGNEAATPRGRGLLVSMDSRGFPLDSDSAEYMYLCSLCGACAADCATGFDPRTFTREARTRAVAEELVPERIVKVIDRAASGNLSGTAPDAELEAAVSALPDSAETLLYLGDTARSEAKSAKAAIWLLEKAGVRFTVMKNEPDCGAGLGDLIGYADEVRQTAIACFTAMAETGAKTVVVLDPSCAAFMKRQCAEWGILPEAEIVTATAYFASLVESGRLTPKKLGGEAAFHDPCRLARDLEETECARRLIAAMGIALRELFLNRKMTRCCSGPVLRETNPEISGMMAGARWADAASAGAKRLITACPGCAAILGACVPEGAEVVDLYVLLAEACR